MNLIWLDHLRCQEVSLTGGKVANLAHLATDYAVPFGFCLTTQAYQQWAETTSVDSLPIELKEILTTAYTKLAQQTQVDNPPVAVRSSAVDEDGKYASFAGQYETYLNVIGIEAVYKAVANCWVAAQAARLHIYRNQQRSRKDEILEIESPLAILVQWLIPADCAFVAFSINPTSNQQDEVIINANWGLGESIVSGLTSPDTYVVSKSDWKLREQIVADKQSMTVISKEGIKTVTVPRLLREQAVLSVEQAVFIAQLSSNLERKMGWPVDIEGAFLGDKLYLLQCRPISMLCR